jgi:site-specific DNA recombinase
MRRVLGYARVSSEEQAKGSSLQDQQDAIRAYASARKLTVTRFYVEAESAVHEKIERRAQVRALLKDVRKGDLVLVDKIDRWSRDPEFTYRSVRELLAAGANLYAVGDAIDASTPEGDTALGFRILFAREEHKRIKQRLVGTRRLLRERGYYADGQPPFGYRRPPANKGDRLAKNVLVVVPEEADVVRRVFDLYVRGRSFAQVAAEFGLTLFHTSKILKRRTYLGEVRTPSGEWIKGHHEPIVTSRTFEAARKRIEEARLGGPRARSGDVGTSDWIARDVAHCGRCGARMSAVYGPKRPNRRFYYRCSQRCKARKATACRHIAHAAVEEAVAVLVGRRLGEMRAELARAPAAEERPTTDIESRRAKLQRKRERYQEQYADEMMTREELRAAMVRLDEERLRLDAEEEASKAPAPLATRAERRAALGYLRELKGVWSDAAGRVRRQIVNHLAIEVAVMPDEEPVVRWRPVEEIDLEFVVSTLLNMS